MNASDVTIVIPSYNRGRVLCDLLERLFALEQQPREILVVDQTLDHPPAIVAALQSWSDRNKIRWIRLEQPSIPRAMNAGLAAAATPLVLYLDDDDVPTPGLVAEHAAAYRDDAIWAVVGQILQPGEVAEHHVRASDDLEFRFNGDEGAFVANAMAGNLSVRRERAMAIGGFDENFTGAAFRFESDFALRLVAAGGRIWFEPAAGVRHLQIPTGGTRAHGSHLTSASPAHSAGDYYFALFHARSFWPYALRRLRKNVLTRFHLKHPWAIPPKLIGELRGLLLARRLKGRGRRLGF